MFMVFSENRTNKQVHIQPAVQNIKKSTQRPGNSYNKIQTISMFGRIQNTSKCKSCGN
jgi:hypothetical protein